MFKRIFVYNSKSYFRNPSALFWITFFPYILAVVFAVVILPLGNTKIEPLKVAVVLQNENSKNEAIKSFFDSISKPDAEQRLLEITYKDASSAASDLNAFKVTGIFTTTDEGKLDLSINRSEIDQTILRSIADSYNQISSVVTESILSHPMKAQAIIEALDRVDTIKIFKDNPFREKGNKTAVFFFSLIGMSLMYAMNFSLSSVIFLQANLSLQGARTLISPAPKSILLLAALLSSFCLQMLNSALFMLFLDKVIGFPILHFGLPLWGLITIANLATIAMGAALATLVKGSHEMKISVSISISMLCAFLGGMMHEGIRFRMINNFPTLARLNPVELITDSFYSMYFFNDQARVWENCLILAALTVVLATLSAFKLRRSTYASI